MAWRFMQGLTESHENPLSRFVSALTGLAALLRRVYIRVLHDDCINIAAQVSFFFVLSLFPFFLVLAAIIGWLPSTTLWSSFVQWIFRYFPRLAQTNVLEAILSLSKWHTGILSFGIITTIWSASSGFASLMEALSVAYGGAETRSYWKKRLIAIVATLASALFFLATFALWTLGQWAHGTLSNGFRSDDLFRTPWKIAWWIFTLFLLCIGIDLINYFLPDRSRLWRWWSPGTVFVVLAFTVASLGLNLYSRYNVMFPRIYGTLAGFIIVMIWIYVSMVILLIGAETDTAVTEQYKREGRG
jgi:membrane protein